MSSNGQPKLNRRQFAGTLAALAAPALLSGLPAPLSAQQKQPQPEQTRAAEPSPEERRRRALKALREFPVSEGAEPAFAFQADWSGRRP